MAVAVALVSVSVVLTLLIRISQLWVLWGRRPQECPDNFAPAGIPPVQILKPLKGVDPDLEGNLRSVFGLNYPCFEVVLGAADPDDPALDVARKVAQEYQEVPSWIVVNGGKIGPNPKAGNLANLVRPDGPALVVISDSNVRVRPDWLIDMVLGYRQAGNRGLVWSLFRGVGEKGLGGMLEALQLNTFVMGGPCAVLKLARKPCALGKSMLMSQGDLAAIGGFGFLSKFLAEDQVCAEEMAALGLPVSVSNHVVDNVLGHRTLGEFSARHIRWACLRRHMNVAAYLVEALLNPVFIALLGVLVLRSPLALWTGAVTLLAVSMLDATVERAAGVKRFLFLYPPLELVLGMMKGILWFVPLFSRRLIWRGNVMKIGPRSLIEGGEPAKPEMCTKV